MADRPDIVVLPGDTLEIHQADKDYVELTCTVKGGDTQRIIIQSAHATVTPLIKVDATPTSLTARIYKIITGEEL